jgi:arginase
MGQGPAVLLEHGLVDVVSARGSQVDVTTIETALPFPTENALAFEMHGLIADQVRQVRAHGEFPLILSGNCNYAAVGAVTGLGADGTGVLWFDAHGESETPETSPSAFLDGMGLAILIGVCWTRRMADVPGFRPLDPRRVAMIGARDLTDDEVEFFPRNGIARVSVEAIRENGPEALSATLGSLRNQGATRLYVHVDADVFDPDTVGHANLYSASAGPGLTAEELNGCLEKAATAIPIHAAAITAYDPSVDPDGRMRRTLVDLARTLSELGSN